MKDRVAEGDMRATAACFDSVPVIALLVHNFSVRRMNDNICLSLNVERKNHRTMVHLYLDFRKNMHLDQPLKQKSSHILDIKLLFGSHTFAMFAFEEARTSNLWC